MNIMPGHLFLERVASYYKDVDCEYLWMGNSLMDLAVPQRIERDDFCFGFGQVNRQCVPRAVSQYSDKDSSSLPGQKLLLILLTQGF